MTLHGGADNAASARPSRRSALKQLAAAATALIAGCDSAIARLRGKRLLEIASVDSVPRDAVYRTTRGDDRFIVTNDGATIRTFVGLCTHEGCPLGWNANQRLIRCPCHGSAFDLRGRVVEGPATRPLAELETFVERGRVLVATRPDTA